MEAGDPISLSSMLYCVQHKIPVLSIAINDKREGQSIMRSSDQGVCCWLSWSSTPSTPTVFCRCRLLNWEKDAIPITTPHVLQATAFQLLPNTNVARPNAPPLPIHPDRRRVQIGRLSLRCIPHRGIIPLKSKKQPQDVSINMSVRSFSFDEYARDVNREDPAIIRMTANNRSLGVNCSEALIDRRKEFIVEEK